MTAASVLSATATLIGLLAPLIRPSILMSNIYLVNLPLILFVGLGSLFSSFQAIRYYNSIAASAAHFGLAAYIFIVLILSFNKKIANTCTLATADSIVENLDTKYLRKISATFTLIVMLACLPYWFEVGIAKTGLATLFVDPTAHLLAREETVKLATHTPFLRLFQVGSLISGLAITFLWALFFLRYSKIGKLRAVFLVLLISVITNINGSRSGFFSPTITSLFSLYIFNLRSCRVTSVITLNSLKKGIANRSIFSFSLKSALISLVLFFSIVAISIQRIAREFSIELFADVIHSVFARLLAIPFTTGASTIEVIDSLNYDKIAYFGGFPGAKLLLGEREPIFMVTGRYIMSHYRSVADTTMNMNTSGLFLNIAFWGVGIGVALFTGYILFNILFFEKYVMMYAPSLSSSRKLFSRFYSAWFLSNIAFNITSSVIAATIYWLLFPLLMYFAVKSPNLLRRLI